MNLAYDVAVNRARCEELRRFARTQYRLDEPNQNTRLFNQLRFGRLNFSLRRPVQETAYTLQPSV